MDEFWKIKLINNLSTRCSRKNLLFSLVFSLSTVSTSVHKVPWTRKSLIFKGLRCPQATVSTAIRGHFKNGDIIASYEEIKRVHNPYIKKVKGVDTICCPRLYLFPFVSSNKTPGKEVSCPA